MRITTSALATLTLALAATAAQAAPPVPVAEPGWLGTVVARGELKKEIEATPILERPYRPLHMYGNTVRRDYYRGAPGPRVRDVVQGTAAFVTRR